MAEYLKLGLVGWLWCIAGMATAGTVSVQVKDAAGKPLADAIVFPIPLRPGLQ